MRYAMNAKTNPTKPVHQSREVSVQGARNRMYPKITMKMIATARIIPIIAAVDVFTGGAVGAGVATGSPGQRLPAAPAELQVPRVLGLARGAGDRLGRAALPAELQPRRDGLAALDARRAARLDGHVRPAHPAELLGRGLLGATLRAPLRRPLGGGRHLAHLARHGVPHADARAEAEARARPAARVRRRGLHRVREGVLLGARGGVPVQDPSRGCRRDGLLHLLRERDAQAADPRDLAPPGREVGL